MAPDLYVSPWWQACLVPTRWDVAGVKVRALSVWHTFALEQLGNPYLCGGQCDLDAAAALLLFCSRDRAGGRRLMLQPLYRRRAMRRMHRHLSRVPADGLHNACLDYIRTCLRSPDHKVAVTSTGKPIGKPAAAPYQFHMVLTLAGQCGMSLSGAWDYPYAEARCLHDAYSERNGDDSLADDVLQRSIEEWDGDERRAG